MIREALAGLARQPGVGAVLSRTPVARDVVDRLVGGDSAESATAVAAAKSDEGYWTAMEWSGEPHLAYEELSAQVQAMAEGGVASTCELAVVPERLATGDRARDQRVLDEIRRMTFEAGIDMTLGSSPEVRLDEHLALAERWRAEGAPVRLTIPAADREAEALCRNLGDQPARLVKGTRHESAGGRAVFRQPIEVDKSFIRCAKAMLASPAASSGPSASSGLSVPSFSTHDTRLLEMVEVAAGRCGREPGEYEFTFFLGRQEGTAQRKLREGHRVRLYIPYGPDWYERLMGGLAEQSSSVGAAVRSLLPGA